ncbi:hypothetical protein HWV62_27476 [Athelia sp. TMB]|nr:hypothetical protein HWV62_27476 [Athelia sp. TMB]
MPDILTPGVVFLARGAISLVFPCALILAVRYILDAHYGIAISIWHIVLAVLVLVPTAVVARHWAGILHKRRRAAALGARLVPKLSGNIGNLNRLQELGDSMETEMCGEAHLGWIRECGNTLNLNILWEDCMFTTEPDHVKSLTKDWKAILATEFPNYVKGEQFQDGFRALLGTGVFNSDDDMWKFHRSMTRPFFTRDRISEFDNFDRHAELMISAMKARMRAGHAIDFQDAIGRFTLDSASEFLFGNDVASLADPLPFPHSHAAIEAAPSSADVFVRAFADAQVISAYRSQRGWAWPLGELTKDHMKAPMAIVNAFLDPILERAVLRHAAAPGEKAGEVAEEETLLDHLVKVTTDRKVLKDEILNILIAGRDTTASTLTFACYLLSQHPDAMERLRAEVLEHVGPSARPTYAMVTDMKYLRAFINETLRLFPAVESVGEGIWPSSDPAEKPFYIPAKTSVFYSAMLTHRRTDLWGPDALEFDPDRFLDYRVRKYITPKPYIFVPFNAGPRICLGQQFAYNEMSFVLIRLLQNFASVTLNTAAQPPKTVPPAAWAERAGRISIERVWPQSHLTMYANGGLWVNMEEVVLE